MKEILITADRQKRELLILLGCFIGAIGLNIIGILKYQTDWKELYTQWFAVLALTVVIYFLILFLRLLFFAVVRLFRNRNSSGIRNNS
jgi:hypothetical protein